MKKIIWIVTFALMVMSCSKEYEFSADFTVPTTLVSADSVTINVVSPDNIILSWTGGGASQGYTTYEVLFDKAGGDFSKPVYRTFSDQGVQPRLTLNNALLNTIARKAGIVTSSTGKVIWTVTASKGGIVKGSNLTRTISVTRGAGIDYTGNTLYLYGTATENNGVGGLSMRNSGEGVFIIYTTAPVNGNIFFKSSTSDSTAFVCYPDEAGKIKEGSGTYNVTANAAGEVYRIIVDLNTQSMTVDKISNIRAIWGATYGVIGTLAYTQNGIFKGDNCSIEFISADRPETNPPSWLSWVEERYYFIATVNGVDKCWGRRDGVSTERPTGSETPAFYELVEFPWSQWDHLWKMSGSLDMKKCTITINTDANGLMIHTFSNIQPL
ncbi:MAG: SusE domain-containing protein [Paludibacter sp.]|nr:SusE domain-containing protein [Paludibacter sp.]